MIIVQPKMIFYIAPEAVGRQGLDLWIELFADVLLSRNGSRQGSLICQLETDQLNSFLSFSLHPDLTSLDRSSWRNGAQFDGKNEMADYKVDNQVSSSKNGRSTNFNLYLNQNQWFFVV